jgi:eukaryotic-like serine/threonine-protein kinase
MQPAPALLDPRVGTTLCGKYRLERLLAVGGTASVYQGTHRNGYRVAIKVLHPAIAVNPEFRNRFLREGRVANRVDHPGATRVLDDDIDPDEGSVFLVMELLDGETLEARALHSGGALGHEEVASLSYQLLDTLVAAHEKGIVHRDIKPENLLLTRDGSLKVLDFGIAHLRWSEPPGGYAVTRVGMMLGTPAYLPPEQARGRTDQIDQRTDIWAVGATMFWLLSGRYVHEAETLEELLVFSGSRAARPLASVVEGIPPALSLIVDRALAFEMENRFRTAREMQNALVQAYPSLPDSLPHTDVPSLSGYALGPNSGGPLEIKEYATADVTQVSSRRAAVARVAARMPARWRDRRVLFILSPMLLAAVAWVFVGARGGRRGSSVSARVPQSSSSVKAVADFYPAVPEPGSTVPPPLATPAQSMPAVSSRPASVWEPTASSRHLTASKHAPNDPCDPPYTVDAIGRRIPKPECL